MTGEKGANGVARPTRVRDYCPDTRELRRLLGRLMGVPTATQEKLAELVGCTADAIRTWESGRHKASPAFRARLVELERRLKSKKTSLAAELTAPDESSKSEGRPEERVASPVLATALVVKTDRDLARFVFSARLPGDVELRAIADVVVSRATFEAAVRTMGYITREPGQ